MPPTEAEGVFFDVLLPLRQANRRRGLSYLACAPDPACASYWEAPLSRTGGVARLPIGEADGAALLERLAAWWATEGKAFLPMLLPELEALRQALNPGSEAAEAEPTPRLSYSAYPLF